MATATLAGGCFWCVEAALKEVPGVEETTCGYAGGDVPDPTYEQVCTGDTGHAEVVRVEFDPDVVSYTELLELFFAIHDPTTEDRQGPDVGSQYRSAVFTHSDDQRETAERVIDDLEQEYDDPIVTEVDPLDEFYRAEEEHQDYYEKHPDRPYCAAHIPPKIEAIKRRLAERS